MVLANHPSVKEYFRNDILETNLKIKESTQIGKTEDTVPKIEIEEEKIQEDKLRETEEAVSKVKDKNDILIESETQNSNSTKSSEEYFKQPAQCESFFFSVKITDVYVLDEKKLIQEKVVQRKNKKGPQNFHEKRDDKERLESKSKKIKKEKKMTRVSDIKNKKMSTKTKENNRESEIESVTHEKCIDPDSCKAKPIQGSLEDEDVRDPILDLKDMTAQLQMDKELLITFKP